MLKYIIIIIPLALISFGLVTACWHMESRECYEELQEYSKRIDGYYCPAKRAESVCYTASPNACDSCYRYLKEQENTDKWLRGETWKI